MNKRTILKLKLWLFSLWIFIKKKWFYLLIVILIGENVLND
jgi:hypothetical protein